MRNLSLLIGLVLAGCAGLPGQDPEPRWLPPPSLEKTLAAAAAATRTGDWPMSDWWANLGNPELGRLIETALRDQPDLRAAASRLEEARAEAIRESARLLPGLEAGTAFGHQRFSANSVQAKLAGERFGFILFNPAKLRWHLDLWGRDRAAIAAAMGRARARRAELAQARLLLATAVARAYLALGAATERLRIAETLAGLQRDRLRVEQARFRSGLATRLALSFRRQQERRARLLPAELRRRTRLLRHQLAYLAGRGPDFGAGIAVAPVTLSERFPLPRDLSLHLIAHRPDVAAAKALALAAAQEVKVARTAFFPDVNLVGFAGFHSVSFSDILFHGSSLAYQIGPTLELPLFEGGRLRAALKAKRAAYQAAVETYNRTVLQAVREVADALSRWQAAERRLRAATAAWEAADRIHRLTLSRHRAGLDGRGPVLEAAVGEAEHRLAVTAVRLERELAAVDLIQALGGGYRSGVGDAK